MHLRVGQRGKQMTDTGIKKKQKWFSSAIVLTLLLSICSYSAAPQSSRGVVENARLVKQESSRPNILLIVADDLAEMRDLSAQHPQKLNELITLWEKYVQENSVILPDWISGY